MHAGSFLMSHACNAVDLEPSIDSEECDHSLELAEAHPPVLHGCVEGGKYGTLAGSDERRHHCHECDIQANCHLGGQGCSEPGQTPPCWTAPAFVGMT
jgi:hypothetical protein